MNLSPDIVFKTLVLQGDRTGPIVTCIPSDAELDLKAISRISGNKIVAMIPVKDVQSITGYIRGSVSPNGMKKKLPTFIHDTVLTFEKIGISGGKAGVEIPLKCNDLCRITQAIIHPIIKSPLNQTT